MAGVQTVTDEPLQKGTAELRAAEKTGAGEAATQAPGAANGAAAPANAKERDASVREDGGEVVADDDNADDTDDVAGEPHPLQFRWSLWHDQPPKTMKAVWGAELREIASFGTVEEFWSLFNNLLEPSRLPMQQTYSLFKHGIRPEWEDPTLKHGGEWRVQVGRDSVDQHWVDTVLALIGEAFDAPESDEIAGIVLNVRKGGQNRVAIWTKGSADDQTLRNIANRWRQVAVQSHDQIEYFTFQSLKGRGRKAAKLVA